MNYNQFKNISCYEEFEIRCDLMCISKVDVLKEIGHKIDNYYFFVSDDGLFNWFDLEGNYVEYPGILTIIKETHISKIITKCVIPDGVTSIGAYAFYNCKSLTSITIPNSVTSIGRYAFTDCDSLTSITVPDSITIIDDAVFHNCKSLTSINIPNDVSIIGDYAFSNCESLTSITIPDSLTEIGYKSFSNCKSLTSITIPDSVTCIGNWAFSSCESLKEVVFKGKTLEEVEQMEIYSFGKYENIFKFS